MDNLTTLLNCYNFDSMPVPKYKVTTNSCNKTNLLCTFTVLLSVAIIVQLTPNTDYHSIVFFIAGFICFIPGAYHVVYIYLAAKGHPGYSFYSLSLFN